MNIRRRPAGLARFSELPGDVYPDVAERNPSRAVPDSPRQALLYARQGNFFTLPLSAELVTAEALPANNRRVYLLIQNLSAADIYVNFGQGANSLYVRIVAGGNYEPLVAPINSVHVAGAVGGQQIIVVEGSHRIEGDR